MAAFVKNFNLDGIDVDYEVRTFGSYVSVSDFSILLLDVWYIGLQCN